MKVPLLLLLLLPMAACAQSVPGALPPLSQYWREVLDTVPPEFDQAELAARGIDTVYVFRHGGGWDAVLPGADAWSDTLFRYVIDAAGRIREQTSINSLGRYKNTRAYDATGTLVALGSSNRIGVWPVLRPPLKGPDTTLRVETRRSRIGEDSLLTTVVSWKFNDGWDTAWVETERRDRAGQLLEKTARTNDRRAREIDDDTQSLRYHFSRTYNAAAATVEETEWDAQGRPVTVRSLFQRGDTVEEKHFDPLRRLQSRRRRVCYRLGGGIRQYVTDTDAGLNSTVLTPLEAGSRLLVLIAQWNAAPFSYLEYYEIQYKRGSQVIGRKWQ